MSSVVKACGTGRERGGRLSLGEKREREGPSGFRRGTSVFLFVLSEFVVPCLFFGW